MSEAMDQLSLLQELLMKVAMLEENVAFLELWCEEQQDALDVVGPPSWSSEDGVPIPRGYAVDVRDGRDARLRSSGRLAGREEVVELHEHATGAGVEPAV